MYLKVFNKRSELESRIRGRDQVYLFFKNEIGNVFNTNMLVHYALCLVVDNFVPFVVAYDLFRHDLLSIEDSKLSIDQPKHHN